MQLKHKQFNGNPICLIHQKTKKTNKKRTITTNVILAKLVKKKIQHRRNEWKEKHFQKHFNIY